MPSLNWMTYDRTGSAQFTAEQGDCTETFFYEQDDEGPAPVTAELLRAKLKEILGYTEPYGGGDATNGPSDGKLHRTLPMAHPIYTTLYAYNVAVKPVEFEFQGIESPENPEASTAPTPPHFADWEAWQLDVKFTQRPFAVLADDVLTRQEQVILDEEPQEAIWTLGTDGDIAGQLAGTSHPFTFYEEWLRYCESEIQPRNDILKWKKGQMVLRRESDPAVPYPATPSWTLPNFNLKVYWYQVPYRYIRSSKSYIRRFLNHINQHAIDIDGTSYEPGELLYANFSYVKHTHPIAGLDSNWPRVPSAEKMVNLTFDFIGTRRSSNSGSISPASANWIHGGHNLLPWAKDRKYYYATSFDPDAPNDTSKWYPQYLSFPLQLLFKDPDAGLDD